MLFNSNVDRVSEKIAVLRKQQVKFAIASNNARRLQKAKNLTDIAEKGFRAGLLTKDEVGTVRHFLHKPNMTNWELVGVVGILLHVEKELKAPKKKWYIRLFS